MTAATRMTVSAVIPAFNHETSIARTLDSLIGQTCRPSEIIVVDDASSDGTVGVVESWMSAHQGVRCALVPLQTNRGVCGALNVGVAAARGDIVVTLASDDWLAPHHIEVCLAVFSQYPEAVVVYSDLMGMSPEGDVEFESYLQDRLLIGDPPQGRVFRQLLEGNFVPAPGAAIRRAALLAAGPYDENLVAEDYDMWLRLARIGDFRWTGEITVHYQISPGSLTRDRRFDIAAQKDIIFRKHANGLDDPSKLVLQRRMRSVAISLYASAGGSEQRKTARRALRRAFREGGGSDLRTVVCLAASHLRIPPSAARSLRFGLRVGSRRAGR